MGSHRADIVTAAGAVVEVQHSPISSDVITAREEFYGERMAWIFDTTQAHITIRASTPVLLNRPCGCADEQCGKIWLSPGTVCICGHDGCRGYMEAPQWGAPQVRFYWKWARASLMACRRPILLDLGSGRLLHITGRFTPLAEMNGVLYSRPSIESWLRDGAKWERLAPSPSEVAAPARKWALEPVRDWPSYLRDFRQRIEEWR
jgi:hypothetical protein